MGSHKKPTAKQLKAIDNIIKGWKITDPKLLKKPKTIVQATVLIKALIAQVEIIKHNSFSDEDQLLQDCMEEAGFFH
jgi:hypothetical protein